MSALCFATLSELLRIDPALEITVLDHGPRLRPGALRIDGKHVCGLMGGKNSRRIWRQDTLLNLRWSVRMGGLTACARAIRGADAILDMSGGDSFTDLYGSKRFRSVMLSKQIAVENGIPLILLPQTYGPFAAPRNEAAAADMVRRAVVAYARDKYSFEVLRKLAGESFDPARQRLGVDVAFLLPAYPPRDAPDYVLRKQELGGRASGVAGINISGLIFNNPEGARSDFGISLNYRTLMRNLVREVLKDDGAEVWLIPHVLTPPGHYESDLQACLSLQGTLDSRERNRVRVIDQPLDQSEAKWIISKVDWFCGTRMHATIAALSSGVPTTSIAYSGKTIGVFASMGVEDCVIDARSETAENALMAAVSQWRARSGIKASMLDNVARVSEAAREQMAAIVAHLAAL